MTSHHLDHPQAWKEVSKGHWSRPLVGLEPYFFFGNATASMVEGREHCTVFSAVKVNHRSKGLGTSLKEAWKQLRYEQPGLATTADARDNTLHYKVPNDDSLELWLADTFIGIEERQSAHWKIDGIGTMLLWQAFFTALGGPQETFSWGDETTRLAPTMEGIWGFSDTPTPELAEEAKALLMSWLAGVPGCGPPSKIGTSPPECQKIDLIFDAQETLALVAASKARKVSVIFAVHSAFALAKAEHATDETKGKDYVSLAQFNLRDYLGSPYNTAAYATNVYYTSIPIITPVGSFDEIAENMNDLYSGAIAKNPKMCELNGHYLRAFFAIAQTPEFLEGPVPGDALVSSLGVGERYLKRDYNGVKVSNLRFAVDVVMGLSIVFLYTFEDHLRLTYCYNEGFQSGLDVQAILDSTADILKHELGF